MNKVKLECCKECPTWWHESDELEEGGWCMYDEERIKCVWSESEIEREDNNV